ncbi:spore gernimation protein [Paenibacillus sp. H1-7]|uniref:GerAB/ArcD/ProY family transporter n=1 Tax=Paenibacillus sp. H1-7 TaxID=2282849 RepID=UPI001EF9A111|nr:endospore germination permease [Paenibacillus sp. H1-7]ULL13174.1 spore gernimation protein [Paenibacillus sp. H1-7]
MLEKGKISAVQMGLMLYPTVLGTGFLVLPTLSSRYAGNDLWLASMLASLTGVIAIYAACRLHDHYPKQSIVQYSENIVGKIPGKILGVIYFLYLVRATGIITREYAEFVKGNFLFKTPILLVIALMIVLAAVAVRGGVEMLARSAVIFTPIFIIPLFLLLFLIGQLDLGNIFPILNHGFVPVLRGTASPQAWMSEFFLMTFFLPCLQDPGKGKQWGTVSLIAVVLSLTYVNLITLFLLGPDIENKSYPVLTAFRYISVANFVENLEAGLLAMWIVGNFVKIAVFYYATVLSLAHTCQLSDYRSIVFPIGILAVICSMWGLPDLPKVKLYLKLVAPFEITTILLIIPMILLIIRALRAKKTNGGEKATR